MTTTTSGGPQAAGTTPLIRGGHTQKVVLVNQYFNYCNTITVLKIKKNNTGGTPPYIKSKLVKVNLVKICFRFAIRLAPLGRWLLRDPLR